MDAASVASLRTLLSSLRNCFYVREDSLASLPRFFEALRKCDFQGESRYAPPAKTALPDPIALAGFLESMNEPLNSVEVARLGNDLWSAVMLRRDEIRNASVLAWLLDPFAGHGHGDALLRDFLAIIRQGGVVFPARPSESCVVVVEECPDGLKASRVDIQIDDPNGFFLVIEVKIDAPEQPGQLQRYCEIAQARAFDGRPWAVVFLTIQGVEPKTAGPFAQKVIPLSWTSVSRSLRRLASADRRGDRASVPAYLARTFAAHIAEFRGGYHG